MKWGWGGVNRAERRQRLRELRRALRAVPRVDVPPGAVVGAARGVLASWQAARRAESREAACEHRWRLLADVPARRVWRCEVCRRTEHEEREA